MAYRVLCDGLPLYDLRSDELVLTAPKVKLSDNSAGSLSFVITPDHPNFSKIKKLKSIIQVFQESEEIFCGRVTEEKEDFYNQKNVYCEGELNYLVDSIQRPTEYHAQTVRGFLQTLLNVHNAQVEPSKEFTVGAVTVTDPNDSLYRYTNYETTLSCISEKLVKRLGGHLRIRKVNGVRYLDYLADYPVTSDQVIEFGTNLLNYSENTDASDIATAVIPLGAKLDEADRTIAALDERVTIKSVNGGSDYLYSQEAVDQYGWVFKTVTFDEVNVPANLKSKGQAYLNDIQFEQMTLDVTAVDLHDMDVDIDKIGMLNKVRVKSSLHGLDRFFPVTEMEISIDSPERNTLKLGEEKTASMTSKSSSSNSDIIKKIESIPSESDILQEAKDNATALINSATKGHVYTTAEEQLIMDTGDPKTAQRLWRWNLNGFGYSSAGYDGPYDTAITMDGGILGKFIVANSIDASKLTVEYTTHVEKQISDVQSDVELSFNNTLKNYYTAVQVTTAIQNNAESVTLSVTQKAQTYVDNALKGYYTKSEIDVNVDGIKLEVMKTYATKSALDNYPKISEVRSKFAMDASSITIDTGKLTFNSNTIEINSDAFKLDSKGHVTIQGDSKLEIYNVNTASKTYFSGGYMVTEYKNGEYRKRISLGATIGITSFTMYDDTGNNGIELAVTGRYTVNDYGVAYDTRQGCLRFWNNAGLRVAVGAQNLTLCASNEETYYIKYGVYNHAWRFMPNCNAEISLGDENNRWGVIYCTSINLNGHAVYLHSDGTVKWR